jgi:AraC family transcriptional regulator
MPKINIATLDPISNVPLKVIADANVVWSSGKTAWDGLVVEQHEFDKIETPEFKINHYSLVIQLSPPATIERKVKGFWKSLTNETGNICLFSAGAPRQIRTEQRHELLVITISPEVINRAEGESSAASNRELAEYHQLRDAQIQHIGLALKAEAESGYPSGRLYGESLGVALSTHLLSKYSVGETHISEHKGGMTPRSLRRVIEYIHDNLAEDLRLSELAEVAGLSQYRFSHNFKDTTGLAPHQYVIRERVERAKRMLRETDMTVLAVAYAVGCSNQSRFTLLFRRATGVTPSSYRASFK